jgi:tetratricopeptide (TPR) repeat protein
MKMPDRQTLRSICLLALPVVLLFCPAAALADGKWYAPSWPYRCRVTVDKPEATGLDGDDIAVVTLQPAGLSRKDGRDIRILTQQGKEVSRRVLMVGPGDKMLVAFATSPKVRTYYAYFGNLKADATATTKPLDIRRGVLLEMWHYNGGAAKRFEDLDNVFRRAKKKGLIGRGFRRRVFSGHNPFGPQNKIAAIYTAWFQAPADGRYEFGLSSRNASFLKIDDKQVVHFGGWHGPTRRVRRRGAISLKKGMHKLTLYHVSPWSDPIVVVMWKPPASEWHLMPPIAFTPVARATVGPIERNGRPVSIDFKIDPGGEVFMENRYYQRRDFTALVRGRSAKGLTWQWDFGDGQTAAGPKVEHVFLRPGLYTVTLRAKGYLSPLSIKRTIQIDRHWDKVTSNRLDRIGDCARIVAGYDFSKLDAASNAEAVLLLRRAKDSASMKRACEVFVKVKRSRADDDAIRKVLPIYVETLLAGNQPDQAVAALKLAAAMAAAPATAADMLVRAGDVTLQHVRDPKAAGDIFEGVIARYGKKANVPAVRLARIGVGDVFRVLGDYKKAAEAYTAAGVEDEKAKSFPAIVKGDFARHVEDYLRRGNFQDAEDQLDLWENTMPLCRLEGYSTSLRVRLLLARKQYAAAARLAETLVKVNPASNYAPELLMLAGRAYIKLRQGAAAVAAFKRIIKEYPESSQYADAMRILKKAAGEK